MARVIQPIQAMEVVVSILETSQIFCGFGGQNSKCASRQHRYYRRTSKC